MSNVIDKIQLSGVTYDLVGGGGGGSNVSEVTQAEYDALVSGGTVDPDTLYIISDAPTIDMNDYVTKVANVASVAIITASTSNDTAIIPQSSTGVTTFYLKGGTSGSYYYFNYGYKYNNYNYNGYGSSFYWGSTFTINNGTVSYDSETDIYTITANEGYAYYNIYVAGGTFTIFTEPLVVTGQSAKVIGDSIPVVMDTLNNKITESDFRIVNFLTNSNGLNLQYKKGSITSSPTVKLSDDSTIFTNGSGKLYTRPVSSITSSEVEIMTANGTCYRNFSSSHDGVTTFYDNYWQDGASNYKFSINSNYTSTYNNSIQISYGYCTTKTDFYNGFGTLNIYYRYSGSSIVYSIGNTSNYSNDYSALTSTIKSNYNLDIKLESSAITYTKEDQQYSGYYYWARLLYFNNCQYIPSYSTSLISSATYVSSDVLQHDALQTVFTAYETGGGGGGITSGEVQTMIDESISGKVDTTTFTNILNAYDNALYAISSGVTNLQNTKQDILSAGTGIQISGNVISATGGGGGGTYSAGTNISIDSNNVISMTVPISGGSGNSSIKEGGGTTASGAFSHAEGIDTVASGTGAHSEGVETTANGDYSHTEGLGTVTNNMVEHAEGWYNVSNTGNSTSAQTLFSVGDGTSSNARHNALEIRKNGDIYCNNGTTDVKLQEYIQFKAVQITQAAYDALVAGGTVDSSTIYYIVN